MDNKGLRKAWGLASIKRDRHTALATYILTFAVLVAFSISSYAAAREGSSYTDAVISVEVLRVIDGDTFVARFPDGKVEKVRLRHINTPERGEKGFTEATIWLESRIGKKTIEIKVGIHKDRGNYLRGHYGRVLADIIGEARPSTP